MLKIIVAFKFNQVHNGVRSAPARLGMMTCYMCNILSTTLLSITCYYQQCACVSEVKQLSACHFVPLLVCQFIFQWLKMCPIHWVMAFTVLVKYIVHKWDIQCCLIIAHARCAPMPIFSTI